MNFGLLNKFALSSKLHDITLEFRNSNEETHEIPAHKLILSAHSEFFFHLFDHYPSLNKLSFPSFLDSNQRRTEFQDVESIIKFLYTNNSLQDFPKESGLTSQNSLNFFVCAKVLGLTKLENFLADYIQNQVFNGLNEIKSLANTIKLENWKWSKFLICQISKNFSQLINEDNINKTIENIPRSLNESKESLVESTNLDLLLEIPFPFFKKIIERNDLDINNEENLLKIVIKYIENLEKLGEKEVGTDTVEEKKEFYDLSQIFTNSYFKKHFKSENDSLQKEETKSEKEKKNEDNEGTDDIQETEHTENDENQTEDTTMKHLDLTNFCKFGNAWNVHGENLLKQYKISATQQKEILQEIRFPFIEHSILVGLRAYKIFKKFPDLVLEGLSAKLNRYEESKLNYQINCKSRDNYKPTSRSFFRHF
jgi:hypothetical protein